MIQGQGAGTGGTGYSILIRPPASGPRSPDAGPYLIHPLKRMASATRLMETIYAASRM